MKAIGVKNLKARLSEHLRAVKAGDTILVTERDEVIAELRPARGRLHAEGTASEVLSILAETEEVSVPPLPKRDFLWKTKGLKLSQGTVQELMDHVPGDRD